MESFLQYLILLLIGLLFAKDYLLPPLLKKFGLNGNENNYQAQIAELKEHARVANHEMGEVVRRLDRMDGRMGNMEKDVAFIRGLISNQA